MREKLGGRNLVLLSDTPADRLAPEPNRL